MSFKTIALSLPLLAACAATPADITARSKGTHYDSAQPPKAVANCFTRNNLYGDGYDPSTTEAPNGTIEFALKDARYNEIVFFAAIRPSGSGSSITVWTGPKAIWGNQIEPKVVKGC